MFRNFAKRNFAVIHPYKRGATLGGKSEGVLNAPLSVVWANCQDFYDLSWWSKDFKIDKLDNDIRRVQIGLIGADE